MAPEQSAESQGVEKLDHRNQTRLAGQVPAGRFVPDFRGRFSAPFSLFVWSFFSWKG
jgi:hypothetical protein